MGLVYAVSAIVLGVAVIGVVGFLTAGHLDKKFGTEHKQPPHRVW
jgi:hypothetical protein